MFASFASVCVLSPALPPLAYHSTRVGEEEHLSVSCSQICSLLLLDTHLQLPPFLLTTAKANRQTQLCISFPEDQLSNRICETSLPSSAPLEKHKNTVRTHCWKHGFYGSLLRLERLLALGPKRIVLQVHADPSEPVCHKQEVPVPCPPRTSFCVKAVTQMILPVCGLPVPDPTLNSALRPHSIVAGNSKSQNFHSLTPTGI